MFLLRATLVAIAVAGAVSAADARPKKALGDYSKLCADNHLECLQQCQKNYTSDKDIQICFDVCDDWLDNSCDKVFPKTAVIAPGTKAPKLPNLRVIPGTHSIAP